MKSWVLLILLAGVVRARPATQPTEGTNLALGKVARFDPAPNYGPTRDDDDVRQLFDGVYHGSSWTVMGTVGWVKGERVKLIDVDLGEVHPFGKITFDTATGLGSQVTFPSAVLVFVSTDGERYRFLCDVMTESLPQEGPGLNHRFAADGLKGWGRHVRLAVISGGFFVFCDEIEIMRGEHAEGEAQYLDPDPVSVGDVRAYAMEKVGWATQKNATLTLLREAETALEARAGLLKEQKGVAEARDAIENGRARVITDPAVTPADYKQGPPYRSYDGRAFAAIGRLNAALWPGQSVVVWQPNDWTWLRPLDTPLEMEPRAKIRVEMMQHEWASASFVLTSASDQPQTLSFSAAAFEGPARVPAEAILRIGHVVHVEAMGFNYRDDAIVPVEEGPIVLEPGIAKRIWLTFKTRGMDVKPGMYTASLQVAADGKAVAKVPVALRVWPLRFPDEVSLHSNTWGSFDCGALKGREAAAAQNLADHYNTAFTLHHGWIPYPKPDDDGNFTEPLDFTRMDQMLKWCPEVRLWLLWPGFEWGFRNLGAPENAYGTPLWEKVFTQWVTQIRDHLAEKGVDKQHFAWYWLDEANPGEEWEELCLRPSKLLKQIDPEMQVWMNPKAKTAEGVREIEDGLPYFDTYCPVLTSITGNRKVLDICHRTRNKSWTYVCSSEKNRDPFAYYRWFSWNAWKLGLGGIGMWVYVDDNNMTFSDYTDGVSYGMIYRGDTGLLDSKRWEAWRQGIADYEYLHMLRDAVDKKPAAAGDSGWIRRAEAILGEGVDRVVGDGLGGDPQGRALPDELRLQILECLAAMEAE